MNQDWTDKLRERMAEYSEQPSDRVWEGIRGKAGLPDRRSIPVWLWGSCVAAVLVAGIFLFFRQDNGGAVDLTADNVETVSVEKPRDARMLASDAGQAAGGASVAEPPAEANSPAKSPGTVSPGVVELSAEAGGEVIDAAAGNQDGVEPAGGSDSVAAPGSGADFAVSSLTVAESGSEQADAWEKYLAENTERRGRRRGHLSASIRGGSFAAATSREAIRLDGVFGTNPLDAGVTNAGWIDPEMPQAGVFMLTDAAELEYSHKMPVSIGMSVRYKFGKRLGAESGLNFSILSSDIVSGGSKGEQTLKYVGIPLKLSFDLCSSRNFNLYASAGGMLEKAVGGKITMNYYRNAQFIRTSGYSVKPKELEWSVNASVGASYDILPQLGVFVEPGVSCHFRSNAPVRSIYTDRPTNFSLGFGLLWTFSHR